MNSIARPQHGGLMIEVLVTIAIIALGLTGLVQMQSHLQKSEVESYQRTQAVILVNDMASRISTNRAWADNYTTDSPLGVGADCDDPGATGLSVEERDLAEWCAGLVGAAESQAGSSVGAMVGGRGCVENIAPNQYMVTVVWQGLMPVSAPPSTVNCAEGLYNLPENSPCEDAPDMCRRYVTTLVQIGDLNP